MITYVRLAYASTATNNPAHIRNELCQVFELARQYNMNHQLTGVMLYGNGYFFQCIEGRKNYVDALYQRLLSDPLHHNLTLLSYENRQQPRFEYWGQRYVHFEAPVKHFLSQHQLAAFNPYLLNAQLIQPFLTMLYSRASNHLPLANQALMALETSQNVYMMSLKDMLLVGLFIILILIPLYFTVILFPSTSGFFLF